MVKDTSGQKVGAQMTTIADGSDFTSTVTVYITVDAGTQAIGTVGSGVCTHEGHGYHTYAPSQAETNGDLLAYTFTGSGAMSVTIQERGSTLATVLGSPVTSVAADIAAIKALVPTALVGGRMDASVGAMASGTLTAAAIAADAITAAKLASDVTTELQTGLATSSALSTLSALFTAEMPHSITALDLSTKPTVFQALYMLYLHEFYRSVSGVTVTIKKVNNSTVAFTETLSDASTPTGVTRAT